MPLGEPKRVLIIRPSALGDVCRSVPVLVSLKRRYPAAAIDWIVQDSFADAVSAHPELGRAIPFPRARFARWWRPSVLHEFLAWARGLRERSYDLVIDCQGLARSGLISYLTGAPERFGYSDARELGWLLLTRRVHAPSTLHTVERMVRLAQAAGAAPIFDLRLHTPPRGQDEWARDPAALSSSAYAVVAPTSRWPGKRWPEERFAETVRWIIAQRPGGIERVVLVGGPDERTQTPLLVALASEAPERVVDRIGRTTVAGLMALVERSALVIANDSAALHMGVGFSRPLVALFGPTRTELVGPYGRGGSVLQVLRPDDSFEHKSEAVGRAMMARISTDMVRERAERELSADPAPAALNPASRAT